MDVDALRAECSGTVLTRADVDYGRQVQDSPARGFIAKAELSGESLRLVLAGGG